VAGFFNRFVILGDHLFVHKQLSRFLSADTPKRGCSDVVSLASLVVFRGAGFLKDPALSGVCKPRLWRIVQMASAVQQPASCSY
jgi:hypothetical protein